MKGAFLNGGRSILIAAGITVVGVAGMWGLAQIPTTSTAGSATKYGITGIVVAGLVGMISPLAGVVLGVLFLNVAAGTILAAMTAPKQTPAPTPTQGLGTGTQGGMMSGVKRMTPAMGAVIADNLGAPRALSAVMADNLGRMGVGADRARNLVEYARAKGMSAEQLHAIIQMQPRRVA